LIGSVVGFATLSVDLQGSLFVSPATSAPGQLTFRPQRTNAAQQATASVPREKSGMPSKCAFVAALMALAVVPASRGRTSRSSSGSSSMCAVTTCSGLPTSSFPDASTMELAKNAFAGASREETGLFTRTLAAPQRPVARHLLMPKQVKAKKPQKPAVKPFRACTKWKFRGFEYEPSKSKPMFGKWALAATEEAWVSSKQIENVRRAIVRTMERKGKMWIRIFPESGITQRVAESRYGAGKGSVEYWVNAVRPNQILFEMDGVPETVVRNAYRKAAYRLPCRVRIIEKTDGPSTFALGLLGVGGRGGEKVFEDLPQKLRERKGVC